LILNKHDILPFSTNQYAFESLLNSTNNLEIIRELFVHGMQMRNIGWTFNRNDTILVEKTEFICRLISLELLLILIPAKETKRFEKAVIKRLPWELRPILYSFLTK
jgi:hypothetical protein